MTSNLSRLTALGAMIVLTAVTEASAADLRIGDRSVVEGDNGARTVEVLVLLSGVPVQPVTVDYTTQNGTATAGADYRTASGKLTFARGETSKRVSFDILGDLVPESTETLAIVLSNPTGATIADGTATVTIVDDDGTHRLPTYEVRLTFTGSSGHLDGTAGCPARKNGQVVLEGLVSGNERVAADDDIEYDGTLWLSVDMDQCDADRKPNGEDYICGMTVIGDALVKTTLAVYADNRGGYVQIREIPGAKLATVFGTAASPCGQTLINDEIPLFPEESIAVAFNGTDLKLPSGPLKVGRYADRNIVVDVIRRVR